MPFGLTRQLLRIAPRDGCEPPPLWVAEVEAALLGRAELERGEGVLEVTMFGTPEVVRHRVSRALRSALGDGWEGLLEVSLEGCGTNRTC